MNEQKARMIRGKPYLPGDPELAADRMRCHLVLEQFNATTEPTHRNKLLHDLLGHLGTDSLIRPRFSCEYGYQIRVGDRTTINQDAIFLDAAAITVGSDVYIGPSVQLLTARPLLEAAQRRAGYHAAEPVTIGFGAWLGGGVIIGPGVRVGDETVVLAGTVVGADLPPRVLTAGNPAQIIRTL
jgi:maltose O-acetyltransferase